MAMQVVCRCGSRQYTRKSAFASQASDCNAFRVAPIIGSVIGIDYYWDISTLSVIGILIFLLTNYASMTS